jgi:lipopolysaccharide biosynthesis protein
MPFRQASASFTCGDAVNEIAIEQRGTYVLRVLRDGVTRPLIHMEVEVAHSAGQRVVVPALSRTWYVVIVQSNPVRLRWRPEECSVVSLGRLGLQHLPVLARVRRKDWRAKINIGEAVWIVPLLRSFGPKGRELARSVRMLTQWGFGLSTCNLNDTLSRIEADAHEPSGGSHHGSANIVYSRRGTRDKAHFAIVLHLHFKELWPEFKFYLQQISIPFHLILTTTGQDLQFEEDVLSTFPEAEICTFENRGRDIGPFMQLFYEGRLEKFEYVCKVHGKRSGSEGPRALLGEIWRRATILDLIGSDQQVMRILKRFQSEPKIGMIGSSRFRLPNDFLEHRAAWGTNKRNTLRLAEQLGINGEDFRLDFFGGSMFWVRGAVIEPLRQLNLRLCDFPAESGQLDGEVHHALERIFGVLPGTQGMFLEGMRIDGKSFSQVAPSLKEAVTRERSV